MSEFVSSSLWSAFSNLGQLDLARQLILLSANVGAVSAIMSIFQFAWPVFRKHGFTYRVFRSAITVAVVSAVIQFAAVLAGQLKLADLTVLNLIAPALVVVIVFGATVYAYYQLKERPAFSWRKLIVMFALPLSPVGAFYASNFIRGGLGLLARAL